jgi:hypothetical protein
MRALAVILSVLIALICMLVVDSLIPNRLIFVGYQYQIRDHIPYVSPYSPLHIPIRLPPRSRKPLTGNFYRPPFSMQGWETNHRVDFQNEVGARIDGPATYKGRMYDLNTNQTLSETTYHIDAEGRRMIPHHDANRDGNFFFFGCSFTYGTNVEDSESMPAQFEYAQKKYSAFNYSFPGWGPNNLDRLIHQKGFAADVSKKKHNKAVYWFIDQHIGRVTLPLSAYRVYSTNYQFFPYYYLDNKNNLQTEGTIFDHRGWLNGLYNFFSNSTVVQRFGVDFPPHRLYDMQLFSAILADMRDTLKKQFDMELIVAFFPSSTATPYLIEQLDKHKIRSLDYSNVYSSFYTSRPDWLSDGHPTAEHQKFLANQLIRDLDLNGEE